MTVDAPFRTQVTVAGMACRHCVLTVTEELTGIDGVSGVEVEPASGTVTVLADRQVGHREIASAVDEAGYTLVG